MAENSTNVRTKMMSQALRVAVQGAGTVAPGWVASWAEQVFLTPRRPRRSRTAESVLATGRRRFLRLGGEQVAVWSWGHGPRVLLVHGWSGYGGQLTAFVEPLVDAGFSVVTYDAPAHGESSGRTSSLPEMKDMVSAVARATGGPHAVVAHSFGAAAAALAMRDGLSVQRAVFLAPPSDPTTAVRWFADFVGLPEGVESRLMGKMVERFGHRPAEDRAGLFAPRMRVPLHVFHDAGDAEVPLAAGEVYARLWPGARITRTTGLGHHRILHHPDVVRDAVAFLQEGRAAAA
ncbi:alpha/beta hydrolase [Myxococcaceae bacterium JPH2]|nr:alpha/beta hydrolase [Myxococcaceae bacterium JPH2]